MKHCRMTFEETLAWPLLRINAILEPLEKMAADELMAGVALGPLGGLVTGAATVSNEASKPGAKQSILGETPQLDSRDSYFDYVNRHTGG